MVGMKQLLIFFLLTVICFRTNAQDYGKCPPTEEFKKNFTQCTTEAFANLTQEEIGQLSEEDRKKRFGMGMWKVLEIAGVMNANYEMIESAWVVRITDMVTADEDTAEKLRIGIHACFVGYVHTIESSLRVWFCITNIKDIFCEVPNPQICKFAQAQQDREEILKKSIPQFPSEGKNPETEHPNNEKKLEDSADINPFIDANQTIPVQPKKNQSVPVQPNKKKSKFKLSDGQCLLPKKIKEDSFKCLLQSSATGVEDGVNNNSVTAFFNYIITTNATKAKLFKDSDSCSAKTQANSDEHYKCLLDAYTKNCHAQPDKLIGKGSKDAKKEKKVHNFEHVSITHIDHHHVTENNHDHVFVNNNNNQVSVNNNHVSVNNNVHTNNISKKVKKLQSKTNKNKGKKQNKTKKQNNSKKQINRDKQKSNAVKTSRIKNKKH